MESYQRRWQQMICKTGAKNMNLQIHWKYDFVGSIVGESTANTIFADVGNQLKMGVLDQHHDQSLGESTTDLIYKYPEYVYDHIMFEWESMHEKETLLSQQRKTIDCTIATHYNPDFDAVSSIFLIQKLLEHGTLHPEILYFINYSIKIDQGRLSFAAEDSLLQLHLIFLQIQKELLIYPFQERNFKIIEMGLALLRQFFSKNSLNEGTRFELQVEDCEELSKTNPLFAKVFTNIQNDESIYQQDLHGAQEIEILLPTKEGSEGTCSGIIFEGHPQSALFKYRTRQKYLFMLTFLQHKENRTRAIPSLDESGSNPYTLEGLGYELEREEKKIRSTQNMIRSGVPRFPNGYCNNDDPWYDGRGHSYTIVDAPRDGSCLSKNQIISIVKTSMFWKTRIETATVIFTQHINYSPIQNDDIQISNHIYQRSLPHNMLPESEDTVQWSYVDKTMDCISNEHTKKSIQRLIVTYQDILFDDFTNIISHIPRGYTYQLGCFVLESFVRSPIWLQSQFQKQFPNTNTIQLVPSGVYFWSGAECQMINTLDIGMSKLHNTTYSFCTE